MNCGRPPLAQYRILTSTEILLLIPTQKEPDAYADNIAGWSDSYFSGAFFLAVFRQPPEKLQKRLFLNLDLPHCIKLQPSLKPLHFKCQKQK